MVVLFLFIGWFSHAQPPSTQFDLAPAEKEGHLLHHVHMETERLGDGADVKVLRLPQPLRETLKLIEERYGAVACDCGLYAQISVILDDELELNPSTLLFPGDNPAEWIACACDQDFAYMHLTNESHHLALQNTGYINKGQWLVPAGPARFRGLRFSGPSTEPMGQWIKKAEGDLLHEHEEKMRCQRSLDPKSFEWTAIQYVELIRTIGETQRWKITPIRKSTIPEERRALLRELILQK